MSVLFDMNARALRQIRATRLGSELFLYERAFADCLERLTLMQHRFESALLIGCKDSGWPAQLAEVADCIQVLGPEVSFEDWAPEDSAYDLVLAIGALDTVNDVPLALRLIRHAMRPGSLFLSAQSGGDTLPQLRSAMRAADAVGGAAAAHVHPRIEASAFAPLLTEAGFTNPVVDVDRVSVSYPSLDRLIGDLRAMAATNILTARPRFVGRAARAAAIEAFAAAGNGERTTETFEIVHFAAWTAKER